MIYIRNLNIIFLAFFLYSCGGGSTGDLNRNSSQPLSINVSGLINPSTSYQKQTINVSSNNLDCTYSIFLDDNNDNLYHISSTDNKNFNFRNPIVYEMNNNFQMVVETVATPICPGASKTIPLSVNKFETKYSLVPTNIGDLESNLYKVADIGFDGIVIKDRFSATICYPTPNDCVYYENELFGQDAHNMVQGDFNGDGFEDFAVAWAYFPHTIEPSQKVNAPINIYLNDGNGRLMENLDIYQSGTPTNHPFAYRTIAADFNGDGIDDIFAGSMGIQYRSEDYTKNFINPYPHLLLLSNKDGKFEDASSQIEDQNNGDGQLCNFAHDASSGDPDGDGDIDIFACNILNINDGLGNFNMHDYINLQWQRNNQYGNPMSSLMVDLNNDNYDDILFWNFDNRSNWSSADEGYILLSNNTAEISSWDQAILPLGPFGFDRNKYNHAASGDLNNDGFNDVVVSITRDLPYYEGAYIQILINDGFGNLVDVTNSNFSDQPRFYSHHGEGNIYLRDMNLDGNLDIIHSTRDYSSGYHGSHIAINDGNGNFISLNNDALPNKPDPGYNNYDFLMKALPLNIDNEGCIDFISVTDSGWENNQNETSNYFFSVLNIDCNF
tara:strand:+ start:965 stop:2794 length:1830 start_codon:yes stop_codon:yes gene_type:complete